MAVDGQEHVLDGNKLQSTKGETSLNGHVLAAVERAERAVLLLFQLLCVVSCIASVHSEHNYPSFSFSWRESIIHIMRLYWTIESTAYVAANISVLVLSKVSKLDRANVISASSNSEQMPADSLHFLPNCCDFFCYQTLYYQETEETTGIIEHII